MGFRLFQNLCLTPRLLTAVLACICVFAMSTSCSTIGPKTIHQDQFDYNAAVAKSWNEQMLLNMIRLRYGEAPVFLDVSSIIAQYSLTKSVSLSAGYEDFLPNSDKAVSLGASGTGLWSDRPTITYAPRTGQQFTRSILTPPPLSAIFSMIEAGWPLDVVFGLTLRSINGVTKMQENRRNINKEFFEILNILILLQDTRALSLRHEVKDGKSLFLLSLKESDPNPDIHAAISRLRSLIKLPKRETEFIVVFGRISEKPNEVAVLTSSALEMLIDLAAFFDVPEEHVAQGKTRPAIQFEGATFRNLAPIQVKATKDPPGDPFVAVQNRGYWFWIDDGDFQSKGRFSFLTILMRLAESGEQGAVPAVTISAGP